MILGIGTDILNIQRIRDILDGDSDAFVQQSFTIKEQEEALSRPDSVSYYATRFAGKEAVFKCFGIDEDIRINEIEILSLGTGQPQVTLSGKVKAIATKKGIKHVQLSLSYDADHAIAFAVAQD